MATDAVAVNGEIPVDPNAFIRNSGFGLKPQGPNPDELRKTWENLVAEDAIQAKIVLDEAYEMEYNLYNHGVFDKDNPDPLRLVGLHPKEDTYRDSVFKEWVDRYLDSGIKETYGLTVVEWLNVPIDRAIEMMDCAKEYVDRKQKLIEQIERQRKGQP